MTINFTVQGVSPEAACTVLARLRARCCRWAKQPGQRRAATPYEPAMIWVMENTGHHACHLLMHIPPARLADFARVLEKWVVKESAAPLAPGTLDIRPAYNPHGFRKYMLKGMDPVFAALYRVRAVPQGAVLGKRFGYTQNLGPSQCRKHGTKRPYRWPGRTAAASSPHP